MNWRRFTTVLLVMGGGMMLLALYVQNQQKNKPATEPSAIPATQASQPSSSTAPAGEKTAQTKPEAAAPKWNVWITPLQPQVDRQVIGSLDRDSGYRLQVELDNRGAGIYTLKLTDHFVSVKDKQAWQKDPKGYEETLAKEPGKYAGHYSLLNPVNPAYYGQGGNLHLPLATGEVCVALDKAKSVSYKLDLQKISWKHVPVTPATPISPDSQSAVYEWSLYYNPQQVEPTEDMKLLTIRKTYTLRKNSYSVDVGIELINHWQKPIWVEINQNGPTGVPHEPDVSPGADERQTVTARYNTQAKKITVASPPLASSVLAGMALEIPDELGRSDGGENQTIWIAQDNKFFVSALYVRSPIQGELSASQYRIGWRLVAVQETPTSRTALPVLRIGPNWVGTNDKAEYIHGLEVAPGGSTRLDMDLFAGPKDRELLEGKPDTPGSSPLYSQLQYIDLLYISPCCWFCSVDWLARAMMWLLKVLSVPMLGNFGLAIMLLVVIVRVVMHPLTKYSQVSMSKMSKKMSSLQPEIQKLREKYGDDKAELNRQMMLLYRQQGTGMSSGMLGCLPMLVQMPIWVALWSGIQASIELRHAAFLPVWITDLAAPDALLSWSFSLPLIGNTLNLLPLLLTVAMYLQQKLTPQMTPAAMSPEQASQQKMMKIMLPAMMLLIFYSMPSGLNLYIMASTFVGVIEQYFIRKHIKEREELEKSRETVVDAPGKLSRSNRAKKSKGPFWFKR